MNLVEQQKSFLERKISLINRLKALQGNAVRIMEGLSATLPEWVWLTEVTLTQQNLQIKGKALSNILISDYMRNLGSDGLFQNIGLLGSAQKSQQGSLFLEFTLSAGVVPPQETTPEKKPAEQAKTKGPDEEPAVVCLCLGRNPPRRPCICGLFQETGDGAQKPARRTGQD